MKLIKHTLRALAGGLVLAGAGTAFAQTQPDQFPSPRELRAFLAEHMPKFLSDDATRTRLVAEMLKVPIAPPLSTTFDPNKAIKQLFGDGSVTQSTDCRKVNTPAGERDPGDCTASVGDENGAGAFARLSYSKTRGFGNIKFVKRPPVPTALPDPLKLSPPKLTDAEAYDAARKFLGDTLGLPLAELPTGPAGRRLPVRNLDVQGGGEQATAPITIQKVVFLQRGFPLSSPIAEGQGTLTHVPGPGKAMVMYDADGLAGAAVQGWVDLRLDPTLGPEDTKSSTALLDEISEDLFNEGVRAAADIKFGILISIDQRNQFALLLPAVQVAVMPTGDRPGGKIDEKTQNALAGKATAGVIREYALVNLKPESNAFRPEGK
ncbi:MAG: hypothetical protein ABI794_03500 [Betaproteobacteria bacterium]